MAELIVEDDTQSQSEPIITDATITPLPDLRDRTNEVNLDLARLQEAHRHEIDMLKYGWFGKIFGSEENSSKALTFTLTLLILCFWLAIVIISIWDCKITERAISFFKVIIPVITLAFGYFFGKK